MEMTIREYQAIEIDNLITELRVAYDFSDEEIYDSVTDIVDLSEDEQEMFAEKLGML